MQYRYLIFIFIGLLTFSCNRQIYKVDILIKDGFILDGSGKDAFRADVGIRRDKIAFIGDRRKNKVRGRKVIQARGHIVAPGFIDPLQN